MSFTFDRLPSTNVMHITEWQKHTSELTQQCWRAKALHGVKETGKDYSSNHVRENTWKCSVLETIFTSAKNNDWNNLSSLLQKLWFCQLPYFTISCRGKKYWLMSFHSYNYVFVSQKREGIERQHKRQRKAKTEKKHLVYMACQSVFFWKTSHPMRLHQCLSGCKYVFFFFCLF